MFDWQYIDDQGNETGASVQFESQADAEAWCGTEWESLSSMGIAEMALRDLEAGTEVYKMSLAEPE